MIRCGCMRLRASCDTPYQCPHAKPPESPRARLLKVQGEVNSLFTEVLESGVTGRNVAEALVSIREVLKAVDNALPRVGRI